MSQVERSTKSCVDCSFENAAYVVFIVLMTRVILSYRLNLLIPISKVIIDRVANNHVQVGDQVDENMHEAQKRDALKRSKFWFRNDIITQMCDYNQYTDNTQREQNNVQENGEESDESCSLMTIDEVINGRGEQFPGLIQLIKQYLLSVEIGNQKRVVAVD